MVRQQLRQLAFTALLAVVQCGSWGIDDEPSLVKELDLESLRDISMQRTRYWIKYDFPNCKDCQAMVPIWEQAARSAPFVVCKIDCEKQPAACIERGVIVSDTKGQPVFPQFMQPMFEVWTGDTFVRYQGPKEPSDLFSFLATAVHDRSGPAQRAAPSSAISTTTPKRCASGKLDDSSFDRILSSPVQAVIWCAPFISMCYIQPRPPATHCVALVASSLVASSFQV
jgi:hypothetical protein